MPPKQPGGGPSHVGPTGQASEPKGVFESAAERFQQWRQNRAQTAADYHESSRPVSADTKGMDVDQRYERLSKRNLLPNIGDVAKSLGTPNPTKEQQVEFGEGREQEARDRRRQEIERTGGPGGKVTALATLLALKLPAAAALASIGLEKFASRLNESNQDLRRWSGTINTAFARLEHQALVLDARTARATQGSAGALGAGLKSLRDEMQPMREATQTLKNLAGLGLVTLARGLNYLAQMSPAVQGILAGLKKINQLFDQNPDRNAPFVQDFWRQIQQGNLGNPDRRPRAGPNFPRGAEPPPRDQD